MVKGAPRKSIFRRVEQFYNSFLFISDRIATTLWVIFDDLVLVISR